ANAYSYDSFGAVLNQVETIPQPFKYVGQYGVMTEPNGLYYMRARYYEPKVGRFISEDPIGFEGGTVNLYEYVGSNPVNNIDPTGTFSWPFGIDCGQYVEKFMAARKKCLNECSLEDELKKYEKYGGGSSDYSANLDCICTKMGKDGWGYNECIKTFRSCFSVAPKFPGKPK
ncbi:MAG: RHS repeat-associated core domain-containing protein, partial [Nitrospirae bacterium]|nr:RHS repeat-associated core domain-containing protein [Nitrospirota bacterium]